MKGRKLAVLIVFSVLIIADISAQTSRYQVAYIYNFTNHVEWPSASRTGIFTIGVLGQDEAIITDFQALAQSKKIQGQKIEIKVFKDVSAITGCHILFIPKKYISRISAINSKVSNHNTLLISDMPGSVSRGMAVSFIMKAGKLNFQLDTKNAQKHGLKVSSSLEQLASK